jgi:hypothetical protein
MKIITIAIIMAFSAIAIGAEDESIDPREAELMRLVKQAPKVHLQKLLDYNLEKLEIVYRAALKNADDDDHRNALRESQDAWLKFYAADSVVAGWNAKGGSDAYPAQMEQKVYQVRLRIYQLSTPYRQGWHEVPRIPKP